MILRLGYEIEFEIPPPVAMVALLTVHPSRVVDLRAADKLHITPTLQTEGGLHRQFRESLLPVCCAEGRASFDQLNSVL